MKADLYIGDDVHAVEVVAAPRVGELVIFGGKEFPIGAIAHDADKKKLRLMCEAQPAPAPPAPEPDSVIEEAPPAPEYVPIVGMMGKWKVDKQEETE